MANTGRYIGGGVAIILLATAIGLVVSSLKKLTTEQVGLQYDTHQRRLKTSQLYFAGLHLGPPGYKFIIFPKVYQTISFGKIRCLNKDGLEIELHVQFQYLANLKATDLAKLVMQYENHINYKKVVIDTAEEVIHDMCSTFNVTQFQTSRVQFQDGLSRNLNTRLTKDFMTGVRDVQVSNIKRPYDYEKVVIDKESAKQNILVAAQERPRVLTAANTKKKEAETQATITLNKARTDARIAITKATSQAAAILNAYTTEAETYKSIMDNQKLTVPGLLSYMTTRAIQSADKQLYVNLDAPAKTKFP